MNRISVIWILFLIGNAVLAQKTKQPNIIIIFADDLRYGDVEGFGASYPTPNILTLQKD